MNRIEYREGVIICNGSRTGKELEKSICFLSELCEKTVQETCDLLNQILQAFCDTTESLKSLMEQLGEAFEVSKDICESYQGGRIRHDSRIKAEKPREVIANIKWSEKYRPP